MDLLRALEGTLRTAQRSYAAYRPEVARYLFERGLKAAAAGIAADPARDVLLDRLWRLQLESIGTRMFGVSTDAWRSNAAYPDRFFPVLWIDLVPKLLPLLPPEKRLETVVALFNLGENLVTAAPSVGGLVAEALVNAVEDIAAEGVEPVAASVLVELGIVPADAAPKRATKGPWSWTRLLPIAKANLAQWEPTFIPGAIWMLAEGTIVVAEAERATALHLALAGSRLQLVGRTNLADPYSARGLPVATLTDNRPIEVTSDGAVKSGDQVLGRIEPRGLLDAAISTQGTIVVARRFSQCVEVYALS